jgi:hypothetical protein
VREVFVKRRVFVIMVESDVRLSLLFASVSRAGKLAVLLSSRLKSGDRPVEDLEFPAMDSRVLPRQQGVREGHRSNGRPGLWYALAGVVLFCGYLRLSSTYAENSDMANILLMGWDLLHGNLLLRGWHMSDVSFYPTELVQYALLESVLGLRMTTAHVAAAMTYTLVVLLAVILARGGTSGREALVRTLITGGILAAPQLSAGVYAVDLAVGHIGTSVPLLLGWLLLDRAKRRWWVPPLIAVILAWVLVADPIVEITGVVPLALVAGLRFAWRLVRSGPDWCDAALVGAATAAYALAWVTQALLRALGGYVVSPLPVHIRTFAELRAAGPALWRVLDLFGADFHGMGAGVPLFLAVAHLVSVALVITALGLAARCGVSLVDRVLAVGIVLTLALYLGTLASTEGAHEIAVVLPYAAALAGRMLAPPLLSSRAGRMTWFTTEATHRACAAAGALVLCGYLAGFGYELTFPSSRPANSPLASWLLAHGLRSGLATYWAASSVTVDTGGRVAVRAVTGTLTPYLWMADAAWYDPELSQPNFLILQQPPASELSLLRKRLGPQARRYQVDGYMVLVWNRNLLRDLRLWSTAQTSDGTGPPAPEITARR